MVFQGTVWGPPLWNCFYEDGRRAVNAKGVLETVFADDLNCFKCFDGQVPRSNILNKHSQSSCWLLAAAGYRLQAAGTATTHTTWHIHGTPHAVM